MTSSNEDGWCSSMASITVEAIVRLTAITKNSTIMCVPAKKAWSAPFVVWRLGFYGSKGCPEFQITIEGDKSPTSLRAKNPIILGKDTHLAGTYDGNYARLYVDGEMVAEVAKNGILIGSKQPLVLGARSTRVIDGEFVGLIFDHRIWSKALSAEEVQLWKNKTISFQDPHLLANWTTSDSLGSDRIKHLQDMGFLPNEVSFLSFLSSYVKKYSELAPKIINEALPPTFSTIHTTIILEAADGFVTFYEPHAVKRHSNVQGAAEMPGTYFFEASNTPIAEIVQAYTYNTITIASRISMDSTMVEFPQDNENAVDWMIQQSVLDSNVPLPKINIVANTGADQSTAEQNRGRFRIISPLVELLDGTVTTAYTWLFMDIWFGTPSWDLAVIDLPQTMALNDIYVINSAYQAFGMIGPSPSNTVQSSNTSPLEVILREFEILVDLASSAAEVVDFFSDAKNHILLWPTAKSVRSGRGFSNFSSIDFIVQSGERMYEFFKIESPVHKLFKPAPFFEPESDWIRAEQLIRNACNFADYHRAQLESEGLIGIIKPRGTIVIGRRSSLDIGTVQRLLERNADNSRYQTFTYDDVIEQAKSLVEKIRAVVSPGLSATAQQPTARTHPSLSTQPAMAVQSEDLLYEALSSMLPAQFEAVIFLAKIPSQFLPSPSVAQSTRAIDLIKYMEQQTDGLMKLTAIVQKAIGK